MKKILHTAWAMTRILLVIVTFSIVFWGSDVHANSIITKTTKANGHTYQVLDVSMTFDQAKKYCEDKGGHLVTITSVQEQNIVKSLLESGKKNSYWIGAVRSSNGKFEKWITGEKMYYTNFAPEQPDNFTGKEDALMIYRLGNSHYSQSTAYYWNDIQKDGECYGEEFFGTKNFGLVCEWDNEIHNHIFRTYVTKATTGKNGSIITKCSCGSVKSLKTIYYPKTIYLSTAFSSPTPGFKYDGKKKTPKVTVKGSDGKTISSSNYTVTYDPGRKNVGEYKVKITFKGNYTGTVYRTFDIYPIPTSILKLSRQSGGFYIEWKKQPTVQASGYLIQYSTRKDFIGAIEKRIDSAAISSARISNLKKNKKYYVRIKTIKYASKYKYISRASAVKTVITK